MEAEFDRAEKRREKERKEAERQRKQREEQEMKARKIAEDADRKRQVILEQNREKELRRRQREEEEALQSGGINFERSYRPIPLASLETDKIKLPSSALEALSSQGAMETGRILAFELSLMDDASASVVGKTYCGVSDFTAAEGTVEIPVKSALSLTKALGESALTRYRIRVRYVSIDRFNKVRARVQPLGEGFHANGVSEASIDLKTLLGRALSQQTVLSENDWVPVRHQGQTYVLAVRELAPEAQVILVDTDVEIDMMPSEFAEKEMRAREEAEAMRKQRAERASNILEALPKEPAQGGVTIRARLPESLTASRKFDPETRIGTILDWAEATLGDRPWLSESLEMVQSLLPGQSKVFTRKEHSSLSLREAQFARVENLNFRWAASTSAGSSLVPMEEETKVADVMMPMPASEWSSVKATAESTLDRDLSTSPSSPSFPADDMEVEASGAGAGGTELSGAELFRLLTNKGAEPRSAAQMVHKYLACLRAIHRMGLLEMDGVGLKAVELVEKFKGSTGRVADGLVEWASTRGDVQEGTPSDNKDGRWSEQISILQGMFEGRPHSEIISALEKHNGSVQLAVNELLS